MYASAQTSPQTLLIVRALNCPEALPTECDGKNSVTDCQHSLSIVRSFSR